MKYEKTTVLCCVCNRPIEIYKGKRSNYRRFCSRDCRDKDEISKSNEKWKVKKKKITHSKRLEHRHPWLKPFMDMVE